MSETRQNNNDNFLDRFSDITGKLTAWLTLAMVLVTFVVVVMRYAFDAGFIWLQETVIYMHAFVFMVGAAYTLRDEEHVRVDIFYRSMSDMRRAWVDLIGVIVFLLPLCAFLAIKSWGFVEISFAFKEASRESGGLPYPLLSLLKCVLILMPVVVALQGISLALKSIRTIRGR